MSYRFTGIDPAFVHRLATDPVAAGAHAAEPILATIATGFPCRVTLEDAAPGEPLLLFAFTSNDSRSAFATRYAVYVRRNAVAAATFMDALPPILERRTIALRAFDGEGRLRAACLAAPTGQGHEAEAALPRLFADPVVASVHVHNAAYGCFLARADRA